MTSISKFERDRTMAELASIRSLIDLLTDEDVMTRLSLEERREELLEEIEALKSFEDGTAAAALFFGGKPVVGQRGIESEFAAAAITNFQDLVSKTMVLEFGELGQRGPVPFKSASTLHITNVVRGSFGFLLEEMHTQGQLIDTALRRAVDDATALLSAFTDDDEEHFQKIASEVDERVLQTAGSFFTHLKDNGATLRLVAGDKEDAFNLPSIERAANRALTTSVEEHFDELIGRLSGVLPEGHLFEFKPSDGESIRGRVDRNLSNQHLQMWNREFLDVQASASLRIRQVIKEGVVVREGYTLLNLTSHTGI